MRGRVHGEQIAQVDNPDPFAPAVWRSPVHRTPEPLIWLVQFVRLLWRIAWFLIRHPLLDVVTALVLLVWMNTGWPGLVGLAGVVTAMLAGLRICRPDWFARLSRCRCGAAGGGGSTGGIGTPCLLSPGCSQLPRPHRAPAVGQGRGTRVY